MPLILAGLVVIVGLGLAFWLIGNILGLVVMLVVSALVGFAADAMVRGEQLSNGWVAATAAGLVGSLVGTFLIGKFGPILFGVPVIPALVGSILVVLILAAFRRGV